MTEPNKPAGDPTPSAPGIADLGEAIALCKSTADMIAEAKEKGMALCQEDRNFVEGVKGRLDAFELELNATAKQREAAAPAEVGTKAQRAQRKDALYKFAKEFGSLQGAQEILMRHGPEQAGAHLTEAHKAAMEEMRTKTALISDDAAGGFLAPPEFTTEVVQNIREWSGVRSLIQIDGISRNSKTINKKTGRTSAVWNGEAKASTRTALTWAQINIQAHMLTAEEAMSVESLMDPLVNLETELAADVAESFMIAEAQAILYGTGNEQPEGILTNAEVLANFNITGDADQITGDGIVRTVFGLKQPYVDNATILLNRATLREVRLLKDLQGRYLWDANLALGTLARPQILGLNYNESPEMTAPDAAGLYTANAIALIVADFRRLYRGVERMAMSVVRDPYTLASEGQVRFVFRRRFGGRVLLPEAARVLKVSAS